LPSPFDDVRVAIDAHEITRGHLAPEATDTGDDDVPSSASRTLTWPASLSS
jgi:hypothetical protein